MIDDSSDSSSKIQNRKVTFKRILYIIKTRNQSFDHFSSLFNVSLSFLLQNTFSIKILTTIALIVQQLLVTI